MGRAQIEEGVGVERVNLSAIQVTWAMAIYGFIAAVLFAIFRNLGGGRLEDIGVVSGTGKDPRTATGTSTVVIGPGTGSPG